MTSKNPDNDIEAGVVLDPCKSVGDAMLGKSKDVTSNGCNEGFVADPDNRLCYIVLPDIMVDTTGLDLCLRNYNASLLFFETDNEVRTFHEFLSSGEKTD